MRVLVVDDKELMRDSVATTLARAGMQPAAAPDGPTALHMIADRRPAVVITDLQMPGMTGLELLAEIRKVDEQLPIVLMTAYATVQTAVEAMKNGAFDYIMKPFEGDQLVATIRRAAKHAQLLRENDVLRTQLEGSGDASGRRAGVSSRSRRPMLVGDSPALRSLRDQVERLAPSQGTVLISGESGVGKEVVAQMIHARSPRASAPMLALNCAAISTSLLESELFGHEKGAFTGADRLRKGRFELADGGTLLLDEISEIAPTIQAKLLRVLQERAFERVGSSVTQKTDVRVIATTNRNLREQVSTGSFRQDLFFRLHVLPIHVPPLRERPDDVPALCAHFLGLVARREGKPAKRFADEALDVLMRYAWPGNVRELYNICERASILATEEVIAAGLVEPWLGAPSQAVPPQRASSSSSPAGAEDVHVRANGSTSCDPGLASVNGESNGSAVPIGGRPLEEIERDVIVATLIRHNGHRQRTARELRIGIRTLGLKLRKWKDEQLVARDL